MIVTVASFKGGVAKTTTAVHLAAYLQQQANTLLIDSDPNRSATRWGSLGKLPFKVIDERQAAITPCGKCLKGLGSLYPQYPL